MNGNFALGNANAAIYQLAASGDLLAQRLLADSALATRERALANNGHTDLPAFEAVFWSRLAAAHGEPADAMKLGASLLYAGQELGKSGRVGVAQGLTAEAVAIVRALAGAGYVPAEEAAQHIMADLPPAIIQKSSIIMEAANA